MAAFVVILLAPAFPVSVAAHEVAAFLGVLLAAEASIGAIAVAVMVFVMQGYRSELSAAALARGPVSLPSVSEFRTRHAERILDRYEDEAGASRALAVVLGSIAATAFAFIVAQQGGGWRIPLPGFANLAFVGIASLIAVLGETFHFFRRARRVSRPSYVRKLALELDEELVTAAAEALSHRMQRAAAIGESDPTQALAVIYTPNAVEQDAVDLTADYIESARRALIDRRRSDYDRTLQYLGRLSELVIANARSVPKPEPLGHIPKWAPPSELLAGLQSLRQAALDDGDAEYVGELLFLQSRFTRAGVDQDRPDLFSLGLFGHEQTVALAIARKSSHFEAVVNYVWVNLRSAVVDRIGIPDAGDRILGDRGPLDARREEHRDYVYELAYSLTRQLTAAVDAVAYQAYRDILESSARVERTLSIVLRERAQPSDPGLAMYRHFQTLRRLGILTTAVRALLDVAPAAEGATPVSNTSARPFLDLAREVYPSLDVLAADVGWVAGEGFRNRFPWRDWESEGRPELVTVAIDPSRYAFVGFVIIALDRIDADTMLNFGGSAATVRDWVRRNLDLYRGTVGGIDPGTEAQLLSALDRAVRVDDEQFEERVAAAPIARSVVDEQIAGFLATRYSAAVVEPSFREVGSWALLSDGGASGRGWATLMDKAPFAAVAGAPRLFGFEDNGREAERDVVERLFDTLPIPSDYANLEQTGIAIAELDRLLGLVGGAPVIVLDGDWLDFRLDLESGTWPEYEDDRPGRQSPFSIGRYRGTPILQTLRAGARSLSVLDRQRWGCVVRHQIEGLDLLARVVEPELERLRAFVRTNQPELAVGSPEFEAAVHYLAQHRVLVDFAEAVDFQVKEAEAAVTVASLELRDTRTIAPDDEDQAILEADDHLEEDTE